MPPYHTRFKPAAAITGQQSEAESSSHRICATKKNRNGDKCDFNTENLVRSKDHQSTKSFKHLSNTTQLKNDCKEKNYRSLAALYNLNLSIVEKYYSILISKPIIPILKTVVIKKTNNIIRSLQRFKTSKAARSRKRMLKSKIKKDIKPKILTIKKEHISDSEIAENIKDQSKILGIESFPFESSNEKQSKPIKCEKPDIHFTTFLKNKSFVPNPFYRQKSNTTNISSSSESFPVKSKSFPDENFDKNDIVRKKQEVVEKLEKEDSRNIHETSTDTDKVVLKTAYFNKSKKLRKKKESSRAAKLKSRIRKRKIIMSSDSDEFTKLSDQNLSVNYLSFDEKANTENHKSLISVKNRKQQLESAKTFASELYNQENINIQDNNSNLNTNTSKILRKTVNQNVQAAKYGCKMQKEPIAFGDQSVFSNENGSSGKAKFKEPVIKNCLNLNVDVKPDSKGNLSQTNSIIINNNTISNAITLPDEKESKRIELFNKRKKIPILSPRRLEYLCQKSVQSPVKTNVQEKISSDNSLSNMPQLQTYNKLFTGNTLGCKTTEINNADESFDSLCQHVTKLSGNENNPFFIENEINDVLKKEEELISQNSTDDLKCSDSKDRATSNNSKNENPRLNFRQRVNKNFKSKIDSVKTPQKTNENPSKVDGSSTLVPPAVKMNVVDNNESISPVQHLTTEAERNSDNLKILRHVDIKIELPLNKDAQAVDPVTPIGNSDDFSQTRMKISRLQKRKIDEAKENTETIKDIDDNTKEKISSPAVSNSLSNVSSDSKRTRLSAFLRLGTKPERQTLSSFDVTYIKDNNNYMEKILSDDDTLSLHPHEVFSSDEEGESSSRYNNFNIERTFVNEKCRNQKSSIKDRLNWNIESKNNKSFESKKSNNNLTTKQQNESSNASTPLIKKIYNNQQNISYGTLPVQENIDKNFYKMNVEQMNEDINDIDAQKCQKDVYSYFGSGVAKGSVSSDFKSPLNISKKIINTNPSDCRNIFFNQFCFKKLRKGICNTEISCNFSHEIAVLQKLIKQKSQVVLNDIIEAAINSRFEYFITTVWSTILPLITIESAFTFFENLYVSNMYSENLLREFFDYCLSTRFYSVESFVKRISSVIVQDDQKAVNTVCTVVKNKLSDGFCWETLRDLCKKARPPCEIIELAIMQCIKRKKNKLQISDVYNVVMSKFSETERNEIKPTILKEFFEIVRTNGIIGYEEMENLSPFANTNDAITADVTPSQAMKAAHSVKSENLTVTSPENEQILTPEIVGQKKSVIYESSDVITNQPNNSQLEVEPKEINNGISKNFSNYFVKELDADEPKSAFRDNFWKLYLTVYNVEEGLNHIDYEYVWKVLDEFSKEDVEDKLLRRAYYQILCNNVKVCQHHVTEIIKEAGNENHVIIKYLKQCEESDL